jgi:hypothetical protein
MKVLFLASNPQDQQTLTLEREITELQRRLGSSSGGEVVFKFLPALPIEEFTSEIMKFRPTVVHLSAHADQDSLYLSNADRQPVEVTGPVLAALLDVSTPPSLVYINACKSDNVAEDVSKVVAMAIGTTAPISNRAARASALLFYERLMSGATVAQAYRSSSALLKALEKGGADSRIFSRIPAAPDRTTLVDVPRIIAQFPSTRKKGGTVSIDYECDENEEYEIEVGVAGCPPDTTQVIFFTDDASMSDEEEGWGEEFDLGADQERAAEYSKLMREPPARGVLWGDSTWVAGGDFRVFACGVTGSGQVFFAQAMVCDALAASLQEGRYENLSTGQRDKIEAAMAELKKNDGANAPLN